MSGDDVERAAGVWLMDKLPLPVALQLLRARNAEDPKDFHDKAYYLAEVALKLAASLRVGVVLTGGLQAGSPLAMALENLCKPAIGEWAAILRETSAFLRRRDHRVEAPLAETLGGVLGTTTFLKVRDFAQRASRQSRDEVPPISPQQAKIEAKNGVMGFFNLVAAYRNKVVGHGGPLVSEVYKELGNLLLDATLEVLNDASLFGGLELAVPRVVPGDAGGPARVQWRWLLGMKGRRVEADFFGPEPAPRQGAEGVVDGRVYFVARGIRVDLHPMLVHEVIEEEDRVGFLNATDLKKVASPQGGKISEVSRYEYLDYWKGHHFKVDVRRELTGLLGRLRGHPVDPSEVDGHSARPWPESAWTPSGGEAGGPSLAAVLARHSGAGPEQFARAWSDLGLPIPPGDPTTTRTERWHQAIRFCEEIGRLSDMLGAMAPLLPPGADADLRAFRDGMMPRTVAERPISRALRVDRTRLEVMLEDLFPAEIVRRGRGPDGAREAAVVAMELWALDQAWKPDYVPDLDAIDARVQRLDALSAEEKARSMGHARKAGWLDAGYRFVDPAVETALAARHLARWFDAEPAAGHRIVPWLLDHIDQMPPTRATLAAEVHRWWDKGPEVIGRWVEEVLDQPIGPLSRRAQIQTMVKLNRYERLRSVQGDPSWQATDDPPSVRWAYRADLTNFLASLLEELDERRVAVFARHLGRVVADGGDASGLARAIRRLVEQGQAVDLPDEPLGRAITASLPRATAEDLRRLRGDHEALHLWLKILSYPLSEPQLDLLIALHRDRRGRREQRLAALARRRLVGQPDLIGVWHGLGEARRAWVEELTEEELASDGVTFLAEWLTSPAGAAPAWKEEAEFLRRRREAARGRGAGR